MRLWTLHPQYLDSRGLVALWREALLAQAVLNGKTVGYRHHPQLLRFRNSASPAAAIAVYLQGVYVEARHRGYSFDVTKINAGGDVEPIVTTQGQLDFEWRHLHSKLQQRDRLRLVGLQNIRNPIPHPMFLIIPGEVAAWEVGLAR